MGRMRRVTEKSLLNSALFYLRRYSATEAHLRRVLARKVKRVRQADPPPAEQVKAWIDATVARLVQAGYLDDQRVASSKASALRRAGKSTRAIRQALQLKGVPAPLVATVVSGDDELSAAWTAARKKRLGPFRDARARDERRQKDLAALVRAGFAYRLAKTIIDAKTAAHEGADRW